MHDLSIDNPELYCSPGLYRPSDYRASLAHRFRPSFVARVHAAGLHDQKSRPV